MAKKKRKSPQRKHNLQSRPVGNNTKSVDRTITKNIVSVSSSKNQSIGDIKKRNKLKCNLIKIWQTLKSTSLKIYGLIALMLALFGGAVKDYIIADIEISPSASQNPLTPFKTFFKLKNDSPMSIYHPSLILAVGIIKTADSGFVKQINFGFGENILPDEISKKSSTTFMFDFNRIIKIKSPVVFADVAFEVKYDYLFFERKSRFFFKCYLSEVEPKQYNWIEVQEADWAKSGNWPATTFMLR